MYCKSINKDCRYLNLVDKAAESALVRSAQIGDADIERLMLKVQDISRFIVSRSENGCDPEYCVALGSSVAFSIVSQATIEARQP